jgi:VanZ family protein
LAEYIILIKSATGGLFLLAFGGKFIIMVLAPMFKGQIKSYVAAIIWAVLILIVSSIPGLSPPGLGFTIADKIVHFAEYFILGLLTARAVSTFYKEPIKILWLSSALTSAYGILDELHQLLVPGRTTEGLDMVADILGSILAVALYVILLRRQSPRVP